MASLAANEMQSGQGWQGAEDVWDTNAIDFTSKMWQLSDVEHGQFLELRNSIKDVKHWKNQPMEVVRFLRARPGNVKAAESMFRKMINWRKENDVENILESYTPPQVLLELYPGAMLEGCDKEGDPIYLERLGVTDGPGLIAKVGASEMIRHGIWLREMISKGQWVQDYEKANGKPVKRITIIEDLQGLSRRMLFGGTVGVYNELMRLDQDNYCESAKRMIIIRAPWIFTAVWSIVKYFFDPGVVKKMVFTSGDGEELLKELDEYVDRTVLPPCISGVEGKGKPHIGMPTNFNGGLVPAPVLPVVDDAQKN